MIDSDLPPFHPDSEFSKLDKMIEDWYEQLPLHLQNTHANFELSKSNEGKHNRQFILVRNKQKKKRVQSIMIIILFYLFKNSCMHYTTR